jgi:hypothetical protein
MMNTQTLDSILGQSDTHQGASEVIVTAQHIVPSVDGALVTLRRTDVMSGRESNALIRLRADGSHSLTLELRAAPDAVECKVMETMDGAEGMGLMIGAQGAWSTHPQDRPLAEAVNALGLDGLARIVAGDGCCVVLSRDALHLVRPSGESVEIALPPLALGRWRHFGQMLIDGPTLVVTVTDPVSGFDVFHADLNAPKPGFEPLLTRGAQRFALNAAVPAMCRTGKGILLGTAALANPLKPVGDWGPELLLLTKDGGWDLISGQPRFSPSGLRLPASSLMPGMGQPGNAAVMAIAHHQGQTFVALQGFAGDTVEDRRTVAPDIFNYHGPVRLYRSADLETWDEMEHRLPHTLGPISAIAVTAQSLLLGHESLGEGAVPVVCVPLA